MKAVRIVVLAIAAVSAIGLAVVVRMALTGKPTSQAAAHTAVKIAPTARVLVASHDLKVGDRLKDGDLDWKSWPVEAIEADWTREDSAPAGASSAPAAGASNASAASVSGGTGTTRQVDASGEVLGLSAVAKVMQGGPKQAFLGAVVRLPIHAGEPITLRKVVRAGESGYLAVLLGPGERAASIPVNVDSSAGGFILPGDRVDVLLTRKLDGGKTPIFLSQTILRDMKVLAIDQTTRPNKDAAAVIGATATLEVSAEEAETLAAAKAAGTLSLTLRSYADARLGTGRNGAPPLRSFSDGVASSGSGSSDDGVRVFRYGQASEESASQ